MTRPGWDIDTCNLSVVRLGKPLATKNEYMRLGYLVESYDQCPNCKHEPFKSFIRGLITRFNWFGLRKKNWAIICYECKKIVGWEDPEDPELLLRTAIER